MSTNNEKFIKRNQHLRLIDRIRIPESRNVETGLRLDRNERVADWPKQLVAEALAQKPASFLSTYPQSDQLYKKLATYFGVDEECILLTSGIDGAIKTLCETVTVPSDYMAVLQPSYAMYSVYADMFQLQLDAIGYFNDLSLDYDALDRCLAKRPSLMFIPNPNQPIDSCLSPDEISQLCLRAAKHDCLVVVDEAYFGFGAPTAMQLVDEQPNIVVLRTFSKGFGLPSIRLGALVTNPENMEVLAKTRFAHEGNALSYAVLEYLLDNPELVEAYNTEVTKARLACADQLADLGIPSKGDYGNFLLLDLSTAEQALAFVAHLRECEIYVKGPWHEPLSNFVSITLGPMHLMEDFLHQGRLFMKARALQRVANQ